ncbi:MULTISPECIES: phage tail spike protein [Enterococcus]|uniref:phage tail spike protein n=1 Tax=Enterococcus TaxID=1350 RepID=UPI00159AF903|nr:phage tail spike protein [Enterococcus hirae]MBE8785366.1 peptidoglycan DD-metalloendopeptidase family protein [Enterococcus hirae]MBE8803873.1 peptidoglycan DD-metalloendopeptidase family protein [Enterococcus hirae]QKX70605.1 peptidoglycan DD-metalloendopeptidase family protein [Enterococcus hirae]
MKPVLYSPTDTDFTAGGIGILSDCKKCLVTEEANGSYTVELSFPINAKFSSQLEDHNYQIKCKPNATDAFHIFYIYNHYKDMATGLLYVYGKSRTMKLGNRAVKKLEFERATCQEAMKCLEKSMDQSSDIRLFSDITRVGSISIEVSNPLKCIKGIEGSLNQIFGGEMKHEPFKLSLLNRRGRDHVTTFRYRKNLTGLKVETNFDGLLTRIFPYADVQNNEGETERIFGNPVDSLNINKYDGEIYSEYVQFTEDQGVTDQKSLNEVSKKYFSSINPNCDQPNISIELNIRKMEDTALAKRFKKFREVGLFDTFDIFHERFKINITAQITKVIYDSLNERVESLEAGDTQYTFFEKQKQEISNTLKGYTGKKYASDFIDVVTNIISGNDGGHVIWWPKNRPTDLFFCDHPKLEEAKLVLRINKSGIGFSSKGWQGPFDTAWTLDGKFNANFIQTGIIKADVFQNSFNKTGDVLRLVNGLLEIRNKNQKIMQLTKKGMEFWYGNRSIGTMGTEGNQFPDLVVGMDSQGNPVYADFDGKALQINLNSDGEAVAISSAKGKGIIIGKKNMFLINDRIDLLGRTSISGRLDVSELYVNGVKIDKNGGGSGGSDPGTIPPQLTTEAEKRAWKIWTMLKARGYSEYAAAGILGNIQGEVGASMNPDTEQLGGPAYGIVQWDGSAYPLVGSPTWNGREYVQRLMNTAGIQEDYRSIEAQVKLLDWCMFNGQWLGKVNPTTVSGFKSINDAKSAAYAFEMNFERPASAHPERQNYAQSWYNKLHGLTSPEPGGNFICPIQKPVTVTSECGWRTSPINGGQEFHNGIDLVNGNPNTPIFAALDGEVVQAGANYYDWYGNYVVIKHNNGKWTGYAHLSRIDVSVGQKVQKGAQIGLMGTTGPSTGEHLHFQIMKNYWPQPVVDFENPRNYIQF